MEQAERDQYLAIVRSTLEWLKAALAGVPRKLRVWGPAPGKWGEFSIAAQTDLQVSHDANYLGQIRGLRQQFGLS
jgi:hypothetical protein